MVNVSSTTPLAPGITEGVPSVLPPMGPLSPLENFRRPDKRKAVVDGEEKTATPGRGSKGNRDLEDSRRARRGRRLLLRGLRAVFSMAMKVDERPEHPLLLLLTGLNISILGLARTNWTQSF
ncbi:hypothetical protein Fot_03690 [Forsythia ovata]|uniref:Uncharacterized protein n=1 Tax=Forsythia ovata TaxID=205694 RepID=A0ABD1XB18_9LAMI